MTVHDMHPGPPHNVFFLNGPPEKRKSAGGAGLQVYGAGRISSASRYLDWNESTCTPAHFRGLRVLQALDHFPIRNAKLGCAM
jgi:hypothetical protein